MEQLNRITQQPDVMGGKRVVAALRQMASELDEGALLTVAPTHARLRVLPLRPKE
ncbi:MAG TPA: hypothetical protein VNT30_10295 [Stellaceae bacterium]|nr:hypothetical protein [Stellaceae bacterium]